MSEVWARFRHQNKRLSLFCASVTDFILAHVSMAPCHTGVRMTLRRFFGARPYPRERPSQNSVFVRSILFI